MIGFGPATLLSAGMLDFQPRRQEMIDLPISLRIGSASAYCDDTHISATAARGIATQLGPIFDSMERSPGSKGR